MDRPSRSDRRRQGKSDPLDAYHAARAVLSGRATSAPKDDSTEAIRSLHNSRRPAVKARTAAINQMVAMVITAPEQIRTTYRALQGENLVAALASAAPTPRRPSPLCAGSVRCPHPRARPSGTDTPGGDRDANAALYRIALVRMSRDPVTRAYVQRQIAAGRTKKETIRMLKRAIAREIFRYLTHQIPVPDYADLRPARQAKNITVTAAANAFNIWSAVISRLARGKQRDDDLASRYRTWLQAA